jgi:prepilin-type N-terminal cleavage/methylation domain-containing protein
MRRSMRRGFTLVELLVVIAIIGILIALLLPAVQAAREAARRSQCLNNMKQVGLALHNYHDSFKSFPPTGVLEGDNGLPAGGPYTSPYHYTWLFMILPFMEQEPLYDQTDTTYPIYVGPGGQPQPVVSTQVATLQCPSASELDLADDTRNMAYTNYAGSEGYHWWPTAYLGSWLSWWAEVQAPNTIEASGLFTITKTRRMADIRDGTSNTVVGAEVNSTGYKWGAFHTCGTGQPRLNTNGERVYRAAFVWTGMYGQCCETGIYKDPAGGSTWWFPAAGPHAFSPTYLTAWGPNCDWPGASSLHSGGLNCLMGDASSRFVSETIAWHVWVKVNGIEDQCTVTQF